MPMDDDSWDARIAARLALHEFLLEQIFANHFLSGGPDPSARWAEYSDQLAAYTGKIWTRGEPEPGMERFLELQKQHYRELSEAFAQKVAQRIAKP